MRLPRLLAPPAFAAAAIACGSSSSDTVPPTPPPALALPSDGLPAACHPFRASGACALPWPSSAYLEPASTRTGVRVALLAETLPRNSPDGTPVDPARWNAMDGFSPATPILAYFPERLDVASLPSQHDFPSSVKPQSATLVVDVQTGVPVEHFAELDRSRDLGPSDRQALMIRPARRLDPGRRYAVGITRSLRALAGGAPAAPPGFATALAGATSTQPQAARAIAALGATVAALEKAGVPRANLLLAWDFTTASDETTTETLLSMRDQALAEAGTTGIGFKIEKATDNPYDNVLRHVTGTFTVPSFLTNDDRSKPAATIARDADGKPKRTGTWEAPFTVIVPKSVETKGPAPLLVFGHGLLGEADDEMRGSHLRQFCNDKGWVAIGTDWIGLSHTEALEPGSSGAAVEVTKEWSRLPWLTDRLQQALVDAMVLVRTAAKIAQAKELDVGQKSAIAPGPVVYYGISLGGIMGMSFMGYDPDVVRGVLNVPGAAWSLMFQRSTNWPPFGVTLRKSYPDFLDQQLLLALAQTQFDFSDPATVAPHVVLAPFPGTPKKQVLVQMALGDSQVPNVATEIEARTAGLPLVQPPAKEVWSLAPAPADAQAALSTWDLKVKPPPETNETPDGDNGAHGEMRKLAACQAQTDAFLRTGKAQHTCNGPCDPE